MSTSTRKNAADKLWLEALRKAALETTDEHEREPPRTMLEQVARALVKKAAAGDMTAAKELGDRLDGKTTQAAEPSGDDGVDEILAAMRERARKLRAER